MESSFQGMWKGRQWSLSFLYKCRIRPCIEKELVKARNQNTLNDVWDYALVKQQVQSVSVTESVRLFSETKVCTFALSHHYKVISLSFLDAVRRYVFCHASPWDCYGTVKAFYILITSSKDQVLASPLSWLGYPDIAHLLQFPWFHCVLKKGVWRGLEGLCFTSLWRLRQGSSYVQGCWNPLHISASR